LITVLYLHDGIGDFLSNGCVTAGLWKPSDVNEWHSFNPIQSTQIKSNQIKSNQIKSTLLLLFARRCVSVVAGGGKRKWLIILVSFFLPSESRLLLLGRFGIARRLGLVNEQL
jgi:hypothetical protein